ncbi:hypothetical protein M0802_004063 [Mischocyttarus mexicanus]|nr:hypothetical protein M0802_004063 [Mischocyttarus mexicanus]
MGTHMRSVVADELTTTTKDIPWSTTEASLTLEEEDAIVTLVVVVIGVIVAIIILFSMGIFIDCRHQKKDTPKKKKLRLKIPQVSRLRRTQQMDDIKSFASDMCQNDATDSAYSTRDATV